jgi:hypothetical protein
VFQEIGNFSVFPKNIVRAVKLILAVEEQYCANRVIEVEMACA